MKLYLKNNAGKRSEKCIDIYFWSLVKAYVACWAVIFGTVLLLGLILPFLF